MTRLLAISVIGALTLAFASLSSSSRASQPPQDALWAWSWNGPDELADFAVAEGFERIYLYCQGGFTHKVKRTITELTERGVTVEALGGEQRWATTERDGMIRFIRSVRRYQHHASDTARLDGVHLDIEPYALGVWDRHPQRTQRSFLQALRAAKRAAGPLRLAADLPFWFDGIKLRYQGRRQALSVAALRELDAATIMAYRDQASDVISVSRRELRQAGKFGKPLTIGVETGKTTPEYVTFFEEGRAALDEALAGIHAALRGKAAFAGTAVHGFDLDSL